jgi:hypothetical protein
VQQVEEQRHEEHGRDEVTISVNGEHVVIHRGRRTVGEIKSLGHVQPAHDLDQLIDGTLTPLPDEGSVVIGGGEVFFSHPKDGQSS